MPSVVDRSPTDPIAEAFARHKADRRARAKGRRERRQGIYQVGARAGANLTPAQARALLEGVRSHKHRRTWRGLAERGLIDFKMPYMPPMPDDWPLTPEGVRVRDALRKGEAS
jgi:hypothetical protein